MTRDAILEAIRRVLGETMALGHLEDFGPRARLNEDLYLDSVLMMNLFLNLELEYGLAVPEEAVTRQPPARVDDMADLFDPEVAALRAGVEFLEADGSVHGDTFVDIKVHCFVSCLCEALKRRPDVDQRPFYFTVWDAGFAIDDRYRLRYHDDGVGHETFRYWYERLYGVEVGSWYDESRSKADNIDAMMALLATKRPAECLMVMLDMFHLPERENKFNQNPFPHYLLLENADDPAMLRVLDVDYRWEGEIARGKVLHAIDQAVARGGFIFDGGTAHPPRAVDVDACFLASFLPDRNPLLEGLASIVAAHDGSVATFDPSGLAAAFRELPILTMRKYAYEHGFAFFWRALVLPDAEFQAWCDEIEVLVSGLKMLHVDVLRLAKTGNAGLVDPIRSRIALLDRQETRIKRRLGEAHALWAHENGLDGTDALKGVA